MPGAEAAPAGAALGAVGAVGADQVGQADESVTGSGIMARYDSNEAPGWGIESWAPALTGSLVSSTTAFCRSAVTWAIRMKNASCVHRRHASCGTWYMVRVDANHARSMNRPVIRPTMHM